MTASRNLVAVCAVVLLWQTTAARAQLAGSLDPSFGTGGQVTTDLFGAAEVLRALAVDADGSLLAAGLAFNGDGQNFVVVRYSADGALKPPVGAVDFHPGRARSDEAVSVAAMADGRIVAAGTTRSDGTNNRDFAVARLLPSLAPDPTFGVDGHAITDFFGKFDSATGMVVQPDGRIVVVGLVTDSARRQNIGLVRYTIDGALDTTFGAGGRVVTLLSPSSERPTGAALQLDGKIVVVANAFQIGAGELAMVRYRSDGSLDPDFGSGGVVLLNGHIANPNAVTIQTDGRIVVAGTRITGLNATGFALWRFEANGALDTSFATAGRVFTDLEGMAEAAAVAVQADGKIVAAGYTRTGVTDSPDVAVARYEADGVRDPTFGADGIAVGDARGQPQAVVIQPGRGIVVGGIFVDPTTGLEGFGLVRYRASAVARRTVTLPPVADVYVRGGAFAAMNFGAVPHLLAKLGVSADNTRISYLKFDVSGVKEVDHATLVLHARLSNASNSSARTTIHAVGDTSWDERAVTWNAKPAVGAALASVTVRGTVARSYEIDVTAYVQAQKRAGRTSIAFAFENAAHSSVYVDVTSREGGALRPALILASTPTR